MSGQAILWAAAMNRLKVRIGCRQRNFGRNEAVRLTQGIREELEELGAAQFRHYRLY